MVPGVFMASSLSDLTLSGYKSMNFRFKRISQTDCQPGAISRSDQLRPRSDNQ